MDKREKFCIFCGKAPEDKNKEHVLPQWLIALTGDPKRVVNFGIDPKTGKVPRFDWSSFVFPSCRHCNDMYSALESQTKELVEKLLAREPIKAKEYLVIFDWLDKVRIGLWLGYSYLHKNPTGITPSFYIDSRIGQKDRMLAVYTLNTNKKGLNAHGAETVCFQFQPSCFSLRINNICLLNMSWDFMCSPRCGFPFPRTAFINLDMGGMLEGSEYAITHKVKHPIMRRKFVKPSIHLYEPIIQNPLSKHNYPDDDWLSSKLIPGDSKKGVLYRQWDDRVEVIDHLDFSIENGKVTGHHCRPLKEIIAQTYDLQLESYLAYKHWSSNKDSMAFIKERNALLRKHATIYKNLFLSA